MSTEMGTRRLIRVEADGTRVYEKGYRYKPVPDSERKYVNRKALGHVLWNGVYYGKLDVLPLEKRQMPPTRPDEQVMEHMDRTVLCACEVCNRPPEVLDRWVRRWQRMHGLQGKRALRS